MQASTCVHTILLKTSKNYKDFPTYKVQRNWINFFLKKCLHFSLHCSPICNGQAMEITKVSLRINEENTIFAYKRWTWNIMYAQNWRNTATCDKGDDNRRQINDVKSRKKTKRTPDMTFLMGRIHGIQSVKTDTRIPEGTIWKNDSF